MGIERAPTSLALVTGIGALAAVALGAWAVGALVAGVVALHRRDP